MTKKEIILNSIKVSGGKEVEGVYEMTEEQFLQLDVELGNSGIGYAFCNNKKDATLKAIYDQSKKNKYAVIRIIPEKKIVKGKTSKKKMPKEILFTEEERNWKEVGNGYVVLFKMSTDKEDKMNTEMTTCEQMKAFIKELHHLEGKVEKLRIYKMGPTYKTNPNDIIKTRLSAWR